MEIDSCIERALLQSTTKRQVAAVNIQAKDGCELEAAVASVPEGEFLEIVVDMGRFAFARASRGAIEHLLQHADVKHVIADDHAPDCVHVKRMGQLLEKIEADPEAFAEEFTAELAADPEFEKALEELEAKEFDS